MEKKDTEDRRMNEKSKMTDREIAEILVPDSTTKPLTDEQVKEIIGRGCLPGIDPQLDKWDRLLDTIGDMLMAQTEILNILKRSEARDKFRMDMQYGVK